LVGVIGLGLIAASALLLAGPAAGSLAPVAAAAGPSLTMVGAATYDVRPASRLVRVTIRLAITNHLSDTVIRRFTFDHVDIAVPATAAHPSATTGTAAAKKVPVTVVSRAASQQVLSVGLGGALGSGRTMSIVLAFNLPDPGGRADRPIRVGPSLVTFPVWAFGSAGLAGSTVVVRFPAGYDVRVVSGPLGAPVTAADGSISLASGPISNPLVFNAVVAADRPSSYVETKVNLEIAGQPVSLAVRAWPDDPAWGTKMSALIKSSLPLLASEIGLSYQPGSAVVAVEEALPRSIDGYAATYLPDEGRIQIAYTADSTTAIHELAHLWFDGSLFADRWIADGFAIFYGNRVAQALKLKPRNEAITPTLAAAALPLNAWSGTDTLAAPTAATPASDLDDLYGRAASVTIAGRLYALVGAVGLQAVWRAASSREAAYQPAQEQVPSLASEGPSDWRGFLDLIAERTGVDASALWASLVVTPGEQALLAARTGTRASYQALLTRAGSWTVPPAVLDALNAWQFDTAGDLLTGLGQLLDQRDLIDAGASAAGLVPPATLEGAFEQGAIATGVTEAANELQVIQAIGVASAAEPQAPSLIDDVGLLGADPDADLAAAGVAFGAGDMSTARDDALAADEAWSQAADTGGFRVRTVLAAVLVGGVLLGFLVVQLRRVGRLGRRARRAALARTGRRPGPTRYPARTARGTLADQPVRMARRVRPGPEEGDHPS
jgi:hypothetical protein